MAVELKDDGVVLEAVDGGHGHRLKLTAIAEQVVEGRVNRLRASITFQHRGLLETELQRIEILATIIGVSPDLLYSDGRPIIPKTK